MTPCEEKGYKVGDRFVTEGSSQFGDGSIVELYQDDGDQAPLFKLIKGMCRYRHARGKYGAYTELASVKPIRQSQRITLAPGDYVATAGMDEATYHAVARAFIEAGAGKDYSIPMRRKDGEYMMWSKKTGNVDAGRNLRPLMDSARLLTPEQVINATNAGGTTTPEPIAALRVAKTALENARDAYSKALDSVRDELGEGFVLVEKGMRLDPADGTLQMVTLSEDAALGGWQEWPGGECPVKKGTLVDVRYRNGKEERSLEAGKWNQYRDSGLVAVDWHHTDVGTDIVAWRLADEPDLTDPANWRAGDVVECLFKSYMGYNYGDTYTVGKRRYDGKRIGVIDDDGCEQLRLCSSFRFHHRPNA